jgi:predicted glycogen debranching enzyme
MPYIKFDKKQLINLEYSLKREIFRSNRAGAYSGTTIVNCNTRKYHGLLIAPQPQFGNSPHVLLSAMHETIIQRSAAFNLGIHKYGCDVFQPKGHKYVRDFTIDPLPKITYRVGGVLLEREMLFSSHENLLMMKYTLAEAHSATVVQFMPFLAFRNIHALSKANYDIHTDYTPVKNGISVTLYEGYTPLFIQFSKKVEYRHAPDWYYNVDYIHEEMRGYEHTEDLFVPGHFEISLKKGESIVIAACTNETSPAGLKNKYASAPKNRIPRNNFLNCLLNAAEQFIVCTGDRVEVIAGYPWFGVIGRDTFMALPGLLLTRNDLRTYRSVLKSMISMMQGPFFPNAILDDRTEYHSVDTQLWFFWALQKLMEHTGDKQNIYSEYFHIMKTILEAYAEGTWFNIFMDDNGLLHAGEPGFALTRMNAVIDGKPETPRMGFPVEINALWYNAICFALELAEFFEDPQFCDKWNPIAKKLKESFIANFWDEKQGYLADCTHNEFKDWSVRPNMLFAVSLPYSPLKDMHKKKVLDIIERELLTPKGLRTLSPMSRRYKGVYRGDVHQRDEAYHQGSVMPWLVGHFAEAYLKVYGAQGVKVVKNLHSSFEPELQVYGIGTVSELYDGDPPHEPSGAVSMAISVAELLRMKTLISNYQKSSTPGF